MRAAHEPTLPSAWTVACAKASARSARPPS